MSYIKLDSGDIHDIIDRVNTLSKKLRDSHQINANCVSDLLDEARGAIEQLESRLEVAESMLSDW